MTRKEILKKAEEEDVVFIRLQFTDLTGTMKNLTIPVEQLEKALNNEIMFDGSSIDGFVRIEGLDGIKKSIVAPPPVYENVYELSKEERKAKGILDLPNNLYDAIKELEKDEMLMDMLGDHAKTKYIAAKLGEWDAYRSQVSQWEIDQCLTLI